jgi:hypothetical protein
MGNSRCDNLSTGKACRKLGTGKRLTYVTDNPEGKTEAIEEKHAIVSLCVPWH